MRKPTAYTAHNWHHYVPLTPQGALLAFIFPVYVDLHYRIRIIKKLGIVCDFS